MQSGANTATETKSPGEITRTRLATLDELKTLLRFLE